MTTPPTEILAERLAHLSRHVDAQDSEIKALHEEIAEMVRINSARERKALMAGISFLGAVILALATVLWNYRGVIFK